MSTPVSHRPAQVVRLAPPPPVPEPEEELFDLRQAVEALGFALRAVRRRRRLALRVAAVLSAATVLAVVLMPRSYHTEARLMAQRNLVMPALNNPRRAVPTDSDAPTKFAAETVSTRDNLASIVKQTNLLDQWSASRAPVLRAKDAVVRLFTADMTDEDKLEALIGLLGKRLVVRTDEGTVTISVDWPNADMAYRIVQAAQQNFLETRHATEVSTIAESISILDGHAASLKESIESTLEEIRQARVRPPAARPRGAAPAAATGPRPDREAGQLSILLTAKRRAISDLEEFRHKKLAELHAQLVEEKNVYGPAHPAIANTETNIQALSAESPQVAQLRREEQDLLGQLLQHGGTDPQADAARAAADGVVTAGTPLPDLARTRRDADPEAGDDERTAYAKARLKITVGKYEDLLERVEAARIELETARAAFKYRYGVITPAKVPKKAVRPRPAVMLGGGFAFAVACALAAAVAADALGGRVLEPWQVERFLRIPHLGEVGRP